jgi:hypothetical protein
MESRSLNPAPRPNKGAPRSFVFDGGVEKTLTIFEAALQRLSFFLCPQTPDLTICEAKAKPFNLIPRNATDVYSLRRTHFSAGAWGAQRASPSGRRPAGVKRAEPTIINKTPAQRASHASGAAFNPPRACSIRNLAIHRVRFQLDSVEITGLCFKMLRFHSLSPHST